MRAEPHGSQIESLRRGRRGLYIRVLNLLLNPLHRLPTNHQEWLGWQLSAGLIASLDHHRSSSPIDVKPLVLIKF